MQSNKFKIGLKSLYSSKTKRWADNHDQAGNAIGQDVQVQIVNNNETHLTEKVNDGKDLNIDNAIPSGKVFPVEDYESLSLLDQLIYDERSFWDYLKDSIIKDHVVLNVFFKKSLYYPQYIRIIRIFSMISFMFGLNAILYSDNDMRSRANLEIISDKNLILYDLPKSLYSYLITLSLTWLMSFIIWLPKHTEEYLAKAIKTKNTLIIPTIQ